MSTAEPNQQTATPETARVRIITPEMDRLNSSIVFISYLLIYLAAPVFYIDVMQAALCDKLGASHMVANLPAAAYLFGSFAPILVSRMIPYRFEREAVLGANVITALLMGAVGAILVLPVSNSIRIAALISQGLVQGTTANVSNVYMFVCLGRGCTTQGRARAYKLTYTIGPIAAVFGSLGAQFVLNGGIHFLLYPYDFAALYFLGMFCALGVAWMSTHYDLLPVPEEPRPPLLRYVVDSFRSYFRIRPLMWLFVGYVLWYLTIAATPNFSLYTRVAVGKEPKALSGVILALRFGFKSIAGYLLGWMTARWGDRLPVITTALLVGAAAVWAWVAPGYWYLIAFGLMGAGELGGNYYPNYVLSTSARKGSARNQAIITLATPLASISPALHGALTERFGFRASFVFGTATAALALLLALKLPDIPPTAGSSADKARA